MERLRGRVRRAQGYGEIPRARRSLEQTVNHVLTRENKHWAENPEKNETRREKWWTEIPYASLQLARKKMGYESEALDEYLDDMPKELMREARKFSTKMIDAENSNDALAVARSIERRMKKLGQDYLDEQEQQQQTPTNPTNDEGDEGDGDQSSNESSDEQDDQDGSDDVGSDDGDGESDGDDDSTDGDDDGDDGDGTNGGGGDEEGDDDSGGDGGGGGADDSDGDDDTDTNAQPNDPIDPNEGGFDVGEAEERAKEAMETVFGKYQSKQAHLVCTDKSEVFDDHKQVWQWLGKRTERKENGKRMTHHLANSIHRRMFDPRGSEHDIVKADTQYVNSKMPDDVRLYAARLARLLLSQEDRRKEGGHRSGKLDARRLSQIKAGNTHVFARNSVTKTAETRIMVAVDGSSSMDWSSTLCAILALNKCLGRANVKFDIIEWGGISYSHADDIFGDAPWIVYHKKASDNWRNVDRGFEFQPCGGDTPTYPSMVGTARIMSEWQEPRRVLLFLTDGVPNGHFNECEMVGNVVNDMRVGGIETYGVYIGGSLSGDDVVRVWMNEMFRDKWTDTTFEKLGETLLGGIEKLLIKGGHGHAA